MEAVQVSARELSPELAHNLLLPGVVDELEPKQTRLEAAQRAAARLAVRGAEVDARNRYNYTALHMAVRHYWELRDNRNIIALLVGRGADIEAKDYYGRTPLRLAIMRKHVKETEELVKLGASVENAKITTKSDYYDDMEFEDGMNHICIAAAIAQGKLLQGLD